MWTDRFVAISVYISPWRGCGGRGGKCHNRPWEGDVEPGMSVTSQWRMLRRVGLEGLGASGSTITNVYFSASPPNPLPWSSTWGLLWIWTNNICTPIGSSRTPPPPPSSLPFIVYNTLMSNRCSGKLCTTSGTILAALSSYNVFRLLLLLLLLLSPNPTTLLLPTGSSCISTTLLATLVRKELIPYKLTTTKVTRTTNLWRVGGEEEEEEAEEEQKQAAPMMMLSMMVVAVDVVVSQSVWN